MHAIRDLVVTYAMAFDDHDWVRLGSLWTEDAAFVVADQTFEGREAVMAFLSTCLPDDYDGKHMNPQTLIQLEFTQVSTATLAYQLRRRGLNGLTMDGLRSTRPDRPMAGFARTLRYLPLREDLSARYGTGMNAQKQAVEQIRPGEVLVIDARGETTAGTIGDILALRAQTRGAAGIVTDGAIRDAARLAALDIPTYHAAVHPAVLGRRHVPWECGVTVACAGVTVQPGDLVVGDGDGVVVLPPGIAAEVLAAAFEQEREEEFVAGRVAAGEQIDGLYPLGERRRPAYEAWLAERKP